MSFHQSVSEFHNDSVMEKKSQARQSTSVLQIISSFHICCLVILNYFTPKQLSGQAHYS